MDALVKNNKYWLNVDGTLNSNRISYDNMVNNYTWNTCMLKNMVVSEVESYNGLYESNIRVTAEIIIV